MEVIKLHEGLDDIAPLLLSVQWCILRLLLTVSDPFMYVQKRLDSNKLTGSLVVPLIWDIRTSLTEALDGLREPAPDEDEAVISQALAMLLLCILKDFNSRWNDGSSIMVYK